MTRRTSAAELRAMARSCREHAEHWPGVEGRAALLASAQEFEELAVGAAREDERYFSRVWADAGEDAPATKLQSLAASSVVDSDA